MPTRKPKDKLSKSDKRMLKRMDKDIKTYSKLDVIRGTYKKQKRKRVIKKTTDANTKLKVKLKKGGGIKKVVERPIRKRKKRSVTKGKDVKSKLKSLAPPKRKKLTAMEKLWKRKKAIEKRKKIITKYKQGKIDSRGKRVRKSKAKSTARGKGRTPYRRG
tara:strand:+ start:11252 stop:11731 length:480 start_codon:yes stop_codon:yes gene_type:complete